MDLSEFATINTGKRLCDYKRKLISHMANDMIKRIYDNQKQYPDTGSRAALVLSLLSDVEKVSMATYIYIMKDLNALRRNKKYLGTFTNPAARRAAIDQEMTIIEKEYLPADDEETIAGLTRHFDELS